MYRYGVGEDSEGRRMNDGLSLHQSYFVDLLLNNSSFVLTINQLIPLFCSSQKSISTSHFPLCII